MDTATFLTRVVGHGNFYCISALDNRKAKPKNWRDGFCPNINAAVRTVAYNVNQLCDVYFACSSFRTAEAKVSANGGTYYVGSRNQANADKMKSLWADLDVVGPQSKAKSKGWASQRDAAQWVATFCAATGIPLPNLVVSSGYGLHFYWTLDTELDQATWAELASALRVAMTNHGFVGDAGITTDAARVLRVPNTWNYKDRNSPQPVKLLSGETAADYTVAAMRAALQPWLGVAPATVATQRAAPAAPATMAGAPPAPAQPLVDMNAAISQNVDEPPALFAWLAQGCGQISKSLAERGATEGRLHWRDNLTLLSFLADGDTHIHAVSSAYPTYTPEDTAKEYALAVNERQRKGIGPITCARFAHHRPAVCDACPHRGAITSPIQLARSDPSAPAPVAQPAWVPRGALETMVGLQCPSGYGFGPNKTGVDYIYYMTPGTAKKESRRIDICAGSVKELRLQYNAKEDRHELVFSFTDRSKTDHLIVVPVMPMWRSDRELFGSLINQGMAVEGGEGATHAGELFMAWMTELRQSQRVVELPSSFGWVNYEGQRGLAIGGMFYAPDGSAKPLPTRSTETDRLYRPAGDLDVWKKAAALFIRKDRPDLAMILAMSFAAPLVELTGINGCVVAMHSRQSGTGKSCAIKVAQAVWGAVEDGGINSLNDTINYITKRLGTVRVLPAWWDELRITDDGKRFADLVFSVTEGKDKGRLGADSKAQAVNSWRTMLFAASNTDLLEITARHAGASDAGMLRIFQAHVEPPQLPQSSAIRLIIDECKHHHGHAGHRYAKYLAANRDQVRRDLATLIDTLNARWGARTDERFLIVACATMLHGAAIAQSLGLVPFDFAALKAFLRETFLKLQERRPQLSHWIGGQADLLAVFTEYYLATQGQWIITTWRNPSSVPPAPVVVLGGPIQTAPDVFRTLREPTLYGNAEPAGQLACDNNVILIRERHLRQWAQKKSYATDAIIDGLCISHGARRVNEAIGVGTKWTTPITSVIELPIDPNGPLASLGKP